MLAAEIDQKLVGAGVGVANTLEELARTARIAGAEHLARHHLEEIAALGAGNHLAHLVGVFAGGVIAFDLGRRTAFAGHRFRPPLQAFRRQRAQREFVAIAQRLFFAVVDGGQLIGQEEVQVGLVLPSFVAQFDRLELEYQIVAHRPVKAQVLFACSLHLRHQRAHHAEDRRLFGTLFLKQISGHRRDRAS